MGFPFYQKPKISAQSSGKKFTSMISMPRGIWFLGSARLPESIYLLLRKRKPRPEYLLEHLEESPWLLVAKGRIHSFEVVSKADWERF